MDKGASVPDQALVASPSSPQAVSTEGFDPSRVKRPGFFQRLTEFSDALFAERWIAELVLSGRQFNCYEAGSNDDDMDDDDRKFRLCIGPITNARYLCDIEGRGRAEVVEAALKVATEAFLEHASAMSAREGQDAERLGAKPASAVGEAETPSKDRRHANP